MNSYKKRISKKNKEDIFLKFASIVLEPLSEYNLVGATISESSIKNYKELMIIFYIINDIGTVPIQADTVAIKDKKREIESFEKNKKSTIDFIVKYRERERGIFYIKEKDPIIKEIEKMQYIPPITATNIRLTKKDIYLKIMNKVGIGKQRADYLYKIIKEWFDNNKENYQKILIELDSKIKFVNDEFITSSNNYFYDIFYKI